MKAYRSSLPFELYTNTFMPRYQISDAL